jgi:hypothetical protein
MGAPIATLIAVLCLAGCCVGGYPAQPSAYAPPFDAFQASMRPAVGMPAAVAIGVIGFSPVAAEVKSCGVLAGWEWACHASSSAAARRTS